MDMLLDTNVILRHLVRDDSPQADAARRLFATAERLVLLDIIAAETLYVLQSFYKRPRSEIALVLRALMAMPNVTCPGESILNRALDLFEGKKMDFPDAYLVAVAESPHAPAIAIATFDKGLKKAGTATVVNPSTM
ncbi:MAG: type II toxin-antitoxin system VapC family toxin [Cellulomonadaceae bacterium]|jgi:predicted nucleic acid-binding protein|nr:type II toxin-antitoxin system VapC family toxin [Cellulomonadaceae bacterium]